MLIYYIVFLISSLLVFGAEKRTLKGKKANLLWIFAVLVPAIIAGMRAETVGTDTSGYIKEVFNMCKNGTNWKIVIGMYQCEIGYYLLNYIVSLVTGSFQILLFVIQILILGPVLIACKDNSDLVEPYISYLFFLLLFYNRSLNMCRQSIAISICIFSVTFIRKQNLIKFVICILLAMSMHRIAFVFLCIYFISFFLKKKEQIIYKFILCVITMAGLIFYQTLVSKLISLGYISAHYLYYANGGKQNISTIEFTVKILFVLLTLLFSKMLNKKNKINGFFTFMLVFDLLIYCLGFYANYAQRISYYIGFFVIFTVPQIAKCMKKNQRMLVLAVLIMIAVTFSYFYYGVSGCDGTVPYKIAKM